MFSISPACAPVCCPGSEDPGPTPTVTPLPDHVPLVTAGLYGFVRHPLYFAWTLWSSRTPHMTLTRFTFAVGQHARTSQLPYRSRNGRWCDVFGAQYRDYQSAVRWRMIPACTDSAGPYCASRAVTSDPACPPSRPPDRIAVPTPDAL